MKELINNSMEITEAQYQQLWNYFCNLYLVKAPYKFNLDKMLNIINIKVKQPSLVEGAD